MEAWNRNKYLNLENEKYVICICECTGFKIGRKYKIIYQGRNHHQQTPWLIVIENEYGGQEIFNIHSPFGNNFCTLKYLRNKKLKKIKSNE